MFWPKLQKIFSVALIFLIIASLLTYQFFGNNLNFEQIRAGLKNFGVWTPLVFIILFTVSAVFVPSTPLMAIAGILFGFKQGFIYTLIGSLLSSVLLFEMSRKLGKEKVEKILENKYLKILNKYNGRLESGGVWDLVIMRVLPILPLNVLNILMGVSKIKLESYILGTILGLIPSNIIAVYFGSVITKLFL